MSTEGSDELCHFNSLTFIHDKVSCYSRMMLQRKIIFLNLLIIFDVAFSDLTESKANESSEENSTVVDSGKLTEAIKDIAYYLRAHKFNEYDRRYETDPERAERRYYKEFPRPPLRSLHWEVHKYCEPSFSECVEFLSRRIKFTTSKRVDDTAVVMRQQHWHFPNNSIQITQVDEECKKQRRIDDKIADPFEEETPCIVDDLRKSLNMYVEGPLERFQWRVTASYFMCWYTIKKIPDLEHLEEACDNFANCLDNDFGPTNSDVRADDSEPYRCALYSFCPDPCCPLKHLTDLKSCWESTENPCHGVNEEGQRNCAFNLSDNTEFSDIILNRWNVSCGCPQHGYEWNSRYGMCKDQDECVSRTHNCRMESEACVNLPGSFRCACKWGDIWSEKSEKCMESSALELIKLGRAGGIKSVNGSTGFLEKLRRILFRRNAAASIHFQTPTAIHLFVLTMILTLYSPPLQ